ncbi:hypothetical protein [Kibdelosporangium philippinense]|nr:hypothetical protein [Kibdelosporangium philippinense]
MRPCSVADEPQAPVGGVKDSGFGHFGSQWGAEFFRIYGDNVPIVVCLRSCEVNGPIVREVIACAVR